MKNSNKISSLTNEELFNILLELSVESKALLYFLDNFLTEKGITQSKEFIDKFFDYYEKNKQTHLELILETYKDAKHLIIPLPE